MILRLASRDYLEIGQYKRVLEQKCSDKGLKFQIFSNFMLVFRTEIRKMLFRIAKLEYQIRLLLQKQPDLGMPCLSRLFLTELCQKLKILLENW